MSEISRFFGIIVRMFVEPTTRRYMTGRAVAEEFANMARRWKAAAKSPDEAG